MQCSMCFSHMVSEQVVQILWGQWKLQFRFRRPWEVQRAMCELNIVCSICGSPGCSLRHSWVQRYLRKFQIHTRVWKQWLARRQCRQWFDRWLVWIGNYRSGRQAGTEEVVRSLTRSNWKVNAVGVAVAVGVVVAGRPEVIRSLIRSNWSPKEVGGSEEDSGRQWFEEWRSCRKWRQFIERIVMAVKALRWRRVDTQGNVKEADVTTMEGVGGSWVQEGVERRSDYIYWRLWMGGSVG